MLATLLVITTLGWQAPEALLELLPPGLEARVTLNGHPVAAGPLELSEGLNLLAVEITAGATVAPTVRCGGQVWGPESGWQVATAPPEAWRTTFGTAGWEVRHDAEFAVPAGGLRLRKALYLPAEAPRWFPRLERVWLPRGSANLIRPYLNIPDDQDLPDPVLRLDLPSGLRCVAVDESIGQPVTGIEQTGGAARLALGELRGSGFELSLRWGNGAGKTITYEPAIRDGGTFDWKTRTVDVVAPEGAVSVTPLIIKWQDRGITGTFWVDNLTIGRPGGPDLLGIGSFDEPAWGKTFESTEGQGVKGSRCVRIVAAPGDERRQSARWVRVGDEAPMAVTAGETYRVRLDLKCEAVRSNARRPNVAALVEVEPGVAEGTQTLSSWLEACGGVWSEVAEPGEVEILPPLRDIRPRTVRITPCYYGDMFSNPEVRAAYAANAWAAGITSIYGQSGNSVAQALLPQGLTVLLSLPWTPWSGLGELTAEGDRVALGYEGKPRAGLVCPTWMLSQRDALRHELQTFAAAFINGGRYTGVDWDIEQPVAHEAGFCTCERCLEAFRATLPADRRAGVARETLLTDYREPWTAFRCAQNAEACGLVREAVKAIDPALEFSVYSGFQSVRTREIYGVDWALLAPHLDLGIAGYGGRPEEVEATREALGTVPFMHGEMYYLSPISDERPGPDPRNWTTRLLRSWLRGDGEGVLIWYLPTMEGGAFWATSEAAAVMAEHEAFIQGAERVPVTVEGELPASDVFARSKGGRTQLWAFNASARPVTGQVRVDGGPAVTVELPAWSHTVRWVGEAAAAE